MPEKFSREVVFDSYVLRKEDGTLDTKNFIAFFSDHAKELKEPAIKGLGLVAKEDFDKVNALKITLQSFAVIDASNKFDNNVLKNAIETDPAGFKNFIENERNWVNKKIPGLLTTNELLDNNGKIIAAKAQDFFQTHKLEVKDILSKKPDLFKEITGIELKEARLKPDQVFSYYKDKYDVEFKNFLAKEQKFIIKHYGIEDIDFIREQLKKLKPIDHIELTPIEPIPGFRIPDPGFLKPIPPTGILIPGLSESQQELIKVKGLDDSRVRNLAVLGIKSPADLLTEGKTIDNRKRLATKLYLLEKKGALPLKETEIIKVPANVFENYYNSFTYWTKQVDLWRISLMDPDTADMLVRLGVRFVEDVKKLDSNKVYPLMESLDRAQTEYKLITKFRLEEIIENAKKIKPNFVSLQTNHDRLLAAHFASIEDILKTETTLIEKNVKFKALRNQLETTKKQLHINRFKFFTTLEIDEPAPIYLFVSENELESEIATQAVNNAEIIAKGLGFLRDVEQEMPLPRRVVGYVYEMDSNGNTNIVDANGNTQGFSGALVEIDGIVEPSNDEVNAPKPQGYTDANGRFIITLPTGYNLKDALTFTFTRGEGNKKGSKSFTVSATEFLNGVDQETLNTFTQLNRLYDIRAELNIENESAIEQFNEQDTDENKKKYNLCQEYLKIKSELKGQSNASNLYIAIENMLNDTGWETEIGKDPEHPLFVIDKATFINNSEKENKLLPSVKFIENNGNSLYLPTDTAPSEVYSYSMIQRLVEPAISPLPEEGSADKPRISLNKAINITNFKEDLQNDPNKIPHMSSLGIGYALNMHQAWIPDGFSLGTLLYSTILAPGEEQRLILREKKQSYEVIDQQEGIDSTAESYQSGQAQKTTEAYNQAIAQMSDGGSDYEYSASSSSSSCGGGFFGLIGGHSSKSSSSGSGNSHAYQNDSYNEASNASRNFQNAIKAASEKISQASRLLIKTASSEESDSVSTKIIANHNHSHAMTIQYWEVMRRYKLQTCIENVDLILFVPMEMISFLNGQSYLLKNKLTVETFKARYELLSKHYDALRRALPYKYRSGLDLAKQYYAYQDFNIDEKSGSTTTIQITFKAPTILFDKIKAVLVLKNGSKIYQDVNVKYNTIPDNIETSNELRKIIKDIRESNNLQECSCTFTCTADSVGDIAYIKLTHDCKDFEYELFKNQQHINSIFGNNLFGYLNSLEAWYRPSVYWKKTYLANYGLTKLYIEDLTVTFNDNNNTETNGCTTRLQSNDLTHSTIVYLEAAKPFLTVKQHQKIEDTMHHIASHTMRYSQAVWRAMSADERALMLEKFTINMNFKDLPDPEAPKDITYDYDDIPLLNCIDVKKMLGFYGNCMMFPFTYPEKLAKRLGKTAFELQDALYRYHTNHFRVPTTVISLPTDGMVGEAVLGETNVSEKIDLTRFWNWQDSPIDKMVLSNNYLNNTDYLQGKNTSSISPLNIQSASTPTAIEVPDLLKELREKERPHFENLTGLDQLKDVLNKGTESAQNALQKGMDLTHNALKTSVDGGKALTDSIMGFINASSKTDMQKDILNRLTETETKTDQNGTTTTTPKYDTSKITPELLNALLGNNTAAAASTGAAKAGTAGAAGGAAGAAGGAAGAAGGAAGAAGAAVLAL